MFSSISPKLHSVKQHVLEPQKKPLKKKSVGVLIHILTLLKISAGSNYVYVPVKTDTQFCASHSKSSNEDHPDRNRKYL